MRHVRADRSSPPASKAARASASTSLAEYLSTRGGVLGGVDQADDASRQALSDTDL